MTCKFGSSLNAFVLNQFVYGLSGKLFERMCEEDETMVLKDAFSKALVTETKLNAKATIVGRTDVNFVQRNKEQRWSFKVNAVVQRTETQTM